MADPERDQALEDYKKSLLELREWEAKLRTLRLGIKDLQREFDISEENIKALQSVGQIIGEVLKQLDEERCMYIIFVISFLDFYPGGCLCYKLSCMANGSFSHRQGIIRTPICRRLPLQGRQGQTQTRNPCRSRYDNTYNHAHVAA